MYEELECTVQCNRERSINGEMGYCSELILAPYCKIKKISQNLSDYLKDKNIKEISAGNPEFS